MAVTHTLAALISELQHREDSFLTSYLTLLDTHLSVCTLLISELLLRIVKDGKAMQMQAQVAAHNTVAAESLGWRLASRTLGKVYCKYALMREER